MIKIESGSFAALVRSYKKSLSGRLRFAEEENGTRHYSIVDIINLKDTIDCKAINRQVEEFSFEEEE